MADIFISCAPEDRTIAKNLSDILNAQGWSTWWDRDMIAGPNYREKVKGELESAGCVIVIWSQHSVDTDWAEAEAAFANNRSNLAPVRIDDAKEPALFQTAQIIDLTNSSEDFMEEDLKELIENVRSILSKSAIKYGGQQTVDRTDQRRNRARVALKSRWESLSDGMRRAIVAGLFALLAALVGVGGPFIMSWLIKTFAAEPPRFIVLDPFIQADIEVEIRLDNDGRFRGERLNIEFDGFQIPGLARLRNTSDTLSWRFVPANIPNLPSDYLEDGTHQMRIAVPGEPYGDPIPLHFSTGELIAEVAIHNDDSLSTIDGLVASPAQIAAETLSVELSFMLDGRPQRVPVAVNKIIDSEGRILFRFETKVEAIPVYSSEDEAYAAPFFALEARDQSGHTYTQELSYAQFSAPGVLRFGAGNRANIEVKELPDDHQDMTRLVVEIDPHRYVSQPADGSPPIVLKLTLRDGAVQLFWVVVADELKDGRAITTIVRDDEPLATSFSDSFTDRQAGNNDHVYLVEQEAEDGTVFRSNQVSTALPTERTHKGIQFVLIEPGSFQMGQEGGEEEERPVHTVEITKPFYMGRNEVTVDQFRQFVEETGFQTEAEQGTGCWDFQTKKQQDSLSWHNPGYEQSSGHPVVCVSWNVARAFAEWADGRLPTEAEWEYAARGRQSTVYPWGNDEQRIGDFAVCQFDDIPQVVASRKQGENNLYDMLGNVWEWTSDRYAADEYRRRATEAVKDPLGPMNGNFRIIRGGSFNVNHSDCRPARRVMFNPNNRNNNVGFRIVLPP